MSVSLCLSKESDRIGYIKYTYEVIGDEIGY